MSQNVKKLAIFDFDGTLFNSPLKPASWKGGWWGKDHSLLPPFVPHHTDLKSKGGHLLNKKVADAYLESKKCPDTHTVMMTGRHWGLQKHVMNILHAFDLCSKEDRDNVTQDSDDFIFISGNKTLEGKLEKLTHLFTKFSEVETVEMWEDRDEHIPHFFDHSEVLNKIRKFGKITIYHPPDWD